MKALHCALALGLLVTGFLLADSPKEPDRPKIPEIKTPVLFNTPEADKILAALQVFPPDNPWNEDISKLPVLPNSKEIIATIGTDKKLAYNLDMGFVIVPPDQKKLPIKLLSYPDESDKDAFPVPDNAPIENWPLDKRELAVAQAAKENGDRHVIIVDAANARLSRATRPPLTMDCAGRRLAPLFSISNRTNCGRMAGPRPTPPDCRSSRRSFASTRSSAAWWTTPFALPWTTPSSNT